MDRPRPNQRRAAALRRLSIALVGAPAALSACGVQYHARHEGPNPYRTEVPGEIGVMTAIAASEQTLRAWGYSIELDLATDTRGRVVGRESEPRAMTLLRPDSVQIVAERRRRTTQLTVEQTTRNEHEARALLRDVRSRLGLPN